MHPFPSLYKKSSYSICHVKKETKFECRLHSVEISSPHLLSAYDASLYCFVKFPKIILSMTWKNVINTGEKKAQLSHILLSQIREKDYGQKDRFHVADILTTLFFGCYLSSLTKWCSFI